MVKQNVTRSINQWIHLSKKLLFLSLYNNYDSLQMIFYLHTIDIFSIASDKNVIIMNNMNMKQKLYY